MWRVIYILSLFLVFLCGVVIFEKGYFSHTKMDFPTAYKPAPVPSSVQPRGEEATSTPIFPPEVLTPTPKPLTALKKKIVPLKPKVCSAYVGAGECIN